MLVIQLVAIIRYGDTLVVVAAEFMQACAHTHSSYMRAGLLLHVRSCTLRLGPCEVMHVGRSCVWHRSCRSCVRLELCEVCVLLGTAPRSRCMVLIVSECGGWVKW